MFRQKRMDRRIKFICPFDLAEHCQQQSNLNLFQILRQIPSTAQHTVDFHSLYFIVDSVKHQILVYDHSTVSRVRAVDLAHFRGIAQFCDLLSQLFQYAAGRFRVKARQIPGDIVQILHSKGQIFDLIRHTACPASPIRFRGLPIACRGQPPAVLPWQVPWQHIAGAKTLRTWRSPQC